MDLPTYEEKSGQHRPQYPAQPQHDLPPVHFPAPEHHPPPVHHFPPAHHPLPVHQFPPVHFPPPIHHPPSVHHPPPQQIYPPVHRNNSSPNQTNSFAAGILFMIIGGMHMGWAIWRVVHATILDAWFPQTSPGLLIFTMTSWWVTGFFGLIIGSVFADRTKKKTIYYVGGAFLCVSSIIYVAAEQYIGAIIAARLLAGFGHGFVYIPLLCQASENSSNTHRGRNVALINFGICFGIFLFTLCNYIAFYSASSNLRTDRLIGIISLVLVVLALILNYFLTIESVTFLLQQGREDKALRNLVILRQEPESSFIVQRDFQEMKQMVEEDKSDGNLFSNGNFRPLLLTFGLRVMGFSTNNYILNIIQIIYSWLLFILSLPQIPAMYLTGIRAAFVLLLVFLSDLIPRKGMLLASMICSGTLLILCGILLNAYGGSWIVYLLAVSFAFFQFSAIGIDVSQDIIMSEAFPLDKKITSIMFVTGSEYIMQIVGIAIFASVHLVPAIPASVPFVLAAVIIITGIIAYCLMPETSKISLYAARAQFNRRKQL